MARPKKSDQPTVNVSLRIDPKIKFAIDLLSREQKRSITGVLEWAVMQALKGQMITTPNGDEISMFQLTEWAWSPDEAERVTLLGIFAPHILSHEESCIWTVMKSSGLFLTPIEIDERGVPKSYTPKMGFIKLVWPLLKARGIRLAEWSYEYQSNIVTEADIVEFFGEDMLKEVEPFR